MEKVAPEIVDRVVDRIKKGGTQPNDNLTRRFARQMVAGFAAIEKARAECERTERLLAKE